MQRNLKTCGYERSAWARLRTVVLAKGQYLISCLFFPCGRLLTQATCFDFPVFFTSPRVYAPCATVTKTRFAFVDFTSIEHATKALVNLRNHRLNGRDLVVEYASPDAVRRGGGPRNTKGDRDQKSRNGSGRIPRRGSTNMPYAKQRRRRFVHDDLIVLFMIGRIHDVPSQVPPSRTLSASLRPSYLVKVKRSCFRTGGASYISLASYISRCCTYT
jgi:RNA recognition motif-containing protein